MQDIKIAAGTGRALPFLMVSDTDHTTPVTGATPSVSLSKNAGPFVASHLDVTELGNGWYAESGAVATAGTVGPLLLHATAAGADIVDVRYEVVAAPGIAPLAANSGLYPLTFLMVQSGDRLTGATGLTPTVVIAKLGHGFATPVGAITEVGFGWYAVAARSENYDVPGPLLLHAEATGADDTDERYDVAGVATLANLPLTNSLLAIQALIVNSGLLTSPRCAISFLPEPFPTPSPPCCAISYEGFRFDAGYQTGGGRYLAEVEGEFVVRFILRGTADIAQQQALLLTDSSRGGLPLIENAINALNEQWLFDGSGNQLTSTGLKPGPIGAPRPYGRDPLLSLIPVNFRTRVIMSMDLPDPA